MGIAPFPHHYTVALDDDRLSARDRSALPIGPPPQFGGTGERDWSPEELLLGAVVACLKTTFDAYARKAGVVVSGFHAHVDGALEKTREGPAFTGVTIRVEVDVAGDEDARVKAQQTLERAERDCIISRSLRAPITIVPTVRTAIASSSPVLTTSVV